MRRHLAHLPWLYGEVVASMPATRPAGGTPVSGTREHGLPVNLPAGELAGQITYDLYAAATWVATDRGIHLPADGRITTVCAWLAPHVDWLAASTYAADVRDVLAELVGRAYGVIDPDRRPTILGPCVEVLDDGEVCAGTLRATVLDVDDPRPSRIWCDTCELELTSEQWFRFGKRYRARLAEIARDQHKYERMAS
ncbi:hypothetical protein GSF24_34650 [Microbispora triticiradicis]|nr:hypothetical protein [Microbispora triticiradicis]